MIKLKVSHSLGPYPKANNYDRYVMAVMSNNTYVDNLSELSEYLEGLGLTYLKNGSSRTSLEPGQWMIQSYTPSGLPDAGLWGHRLICFHESNKKEAMLVKLTRL